MLKWTASELADKFPKGATRKTEISTAVQHNKAEIKSIFKSEMKTKTQFQNSEVHHKSAGKKIKGKSQNFPKKLKMS